MVPCESFRHMDTTNCNLSKIGSKIIATRFCKTWNRILKACIALKPVGDEKWKPRNSINSDQLWVTLLDIFEKCTENENFQIFKFTVFTIFFSSKAWNFKKTLKILSLMFYDITYKQNTGNLFELAYKLKYIELLFWRVCVWACASRCENIILQFHQRLYFLF